MSTADVNHVWKAPDNLSKQRTKISWSNVHDSVIVLIKIDVMLHQEPLELVHARLVVTGIIQREVPGLKRHLTC